MIRALPLALMLSLAASPAQAGPLAPVFAAVAAFAASPLGQIVIGVALQVGGSALQRARARKQQRGQAARPDPGVNLSLRGGGDQPETYPAGRIATGGQLLYAGSWGEAGGTPNEYLVRVLTLSDAPVDALEKIYVDGIACDLDTGNPDAARGWPVTQYRSGGVDHLWVKWLDGSQTVADPYLRDKFAGAANPWGADMIGRGLAIAIVTAKLKRGFLDSAPELVFQMRGIKCYDRSKDTTAGGSGAVRRNDPATWVWSDNPVVIADTLLAGISWNGTRLYGPGLPAGALPNSAWLAAIASTTAAGFRAGIEIAGDEEPAGALEDLGLACNVKFACDGVYLRPVYGVPGAAAWHISDADVAVTEPSQLDPYPDPSQQRNAVTATFAEPAEGWAAKAAPERADAAAVARDGRRPAAVSLRCVHIGAQAEAIANAMALDSGRMRRHALALGPLARLLQDGDTIAWTSARNGYTAKAFTVSGVTRRRGPLVALSLRETDAADYDWDPETDPAGGAPVPALAQFPPAQAMTGWQVEPASIPDASGTGRRPSLRVSFAGGLADVRAVQIQVRVQVTAAVVFDGEHPYDPAVASPAVLLNATLFGLVLYEARGRFRPFSGRETEWSAWLSATTPDIRLGSADVDLASVTVALAPAFRQLRRDMDRVLDRLMETPDGATEEMLATIEGFKQTQALKASAGKVGELIAAVSSEQIARIEGDLAIASDSTAALAQAGQATAGGLVKLEAVAAPSGATARYQVALRASVDGAYVADAAYFLDIVGGKGRFAVRADQFVFLDSGGVARFLMDSSGALIDLARIRNLTSVNVATKSLNAQTVLVDGSITAPLVAAGTITADKIIDNGLTGNVIAFASDSSVISTSGNVWVDALTAGGAPFEVGVNVQPAASLLVMAVAQVSHGNISGQTDIRVLMDGSEIYSDYRFGHFVNGVGAISSPTWIAPVSPSAGNRTLKLQWRSAAISGNSNMRSRGLIVFQFRK